MRIKPIRKLWLVVICLATLLTACNNDDYEGPAPYEVNTTYSNLLANGDNPTLVLTYNDADMIGKNVYFKMVDAHVGLLSLERVIPGEEETNIEGISLTAAADSYSFSGLATGATGATFHYEGRVARGKLVLALNDVKIPSSVLNNEGSWIPGTLNAYKDMSSLTGMVMSVVAYPVLQTIINTTIDQLTFEPDGNILAHYAGLPEGVSFSDLMSGKVQPRPEDEWRYSPKNLATYCVKDNTSLYVYLNIDGIIRQVQSEKGRAASLPILSIIQVYTKLNSWATKGIKLTIKEAGGTAGSILVELDKKEVRALFEILKIVKDLLPEETLNAKALDWLDGIVPEQFQGIMDIFLQDMTVGQLIDRIYTDLDTLPFYIGLSLSK